MIVSNDEVDGNEMRIEREREDALANLEHFGLLMDTTGGMRVRGSLLSNWIYMYEVTHEA